MLRVDRICVWIFMLGLALLLPSFVILTFADELVVYMLLGVALFDCIFNRQWRKYKPLLVFMAVMLAYLVYSLTVVHYNTTMSVVLGWFLELKPFIPILVFMGVAPVIGDNEKRVIRGIALFNGCILLLSLPIYYYAKALLFGHPAMYGATALTSAIVYLFCSTDEQGGFTRRGLLIFFLLMTLGLVSGRSKFYGEYIIALFMIIAYKPQMTRHLRLSHILGFGVMSVIVIAAVWSKLDAYFFSGLDLSTFDMTSRDEFARLALYAMMVPAIALHPLFGTGFGSYASYASGEPGYSSLYIDLGIDKVYGLSPDYHDFVSDAYFPALAQYGIVGIILFIWFWVYIYNRLRPFTRIISGDNRSLFIVGVIILSSYFIEMTSGALVFMSPGEVMACVLGIICGRGALLRKELRTPEKEEEPESAPSQRRIK